MKTFQILSVLALTVFLSCSKDDTSTNPSADKNPPAPPAGLVVADSSDTTLTLRWNGVSGATGYILYRLDTGTVYLALDTVADTVFVDSGLEADEDYSYRVSAYNADGESEPSAVFQARTRKAVLETVASIPLSYFSQDCVVNNGYLYVSGSSGGLGVYSLASPGNPVKVDSIHFSSYQTGAMTLSGHILACAAGRCKVYLLDVAAPAAPETLGSIDLNGSHMTVSDLSFSGTALFATTGTMGPLGINGLFAIDVTNPAVPALLDSMSLPANVRANCVAASGQYAYVGAIDSLVRVFRLNPADSSLSLVDSVSTAPGEVQGITLEGDRCYAATYEGERVVSIDVANPASSSVIGSIRLTDDMPKGIAIHSPYAYVITTWYLRLLDITNPAQPALKATWGEIPTAPVYSFAVGSGYVYVVGGNDPDSRLYAVKVNLQ